MSVCFDKVRITSGRFPDMIGRRHARPEIWKEYSLPVHNVPMKRKRRFRRMATHDGSGKARRMPLRRALRAERKPLQAVAQRGRGKHAPGVVLDSDGRYEPVGPEELTVHISIRLEARW